MFRNQNVRNRFCSISCFSESYFFEGFEGFEVGFENVDFLCFYWFFENGSWVGFEVGVENVDFSFVFIGFCLRFAAGF